MSNNSSALIEAETLLTKRLQEKPDDPRALAERARIRLLEWDYRSAVGDLTRALATNSDDFDAKVDLATAYFESGEISGRQSDYLQAASLLNSVLARDSQNPVALFNKAIVLEHMGQRKEAAAEWREYLKVDSSGAWAKEAQNRLRDLDSNRE
jgi:tetratricopeptide (TPR) repeat protein